MYRRRIGSSRGAWPALECYLLGRGARSTAPQELRRRVPVPEHHATLKKVNAMNKKGGDTVFRDGDSFGSSQQAREMAVQAARPLLASFRAAQCHSLVCRSHTSHYRAPRAG